MGKGWRFSPVSRWTISWRRTPPDPPHWKKSLLSSRAQRGILPPTGRSLAALGMTAGVAPDSSESPIAASRHPRADPRVDTPQPQAPQRRGGDVERRAGGHHGVAQNE